MKTLSQIFTTRTLRRPFWMLAGSLSLAMACFQSGCSRNTTVLANPDKKAETPAKESETKITNSTDQADALVDQGEILFQPKTYDQANAKFAESLKIDSKNQRAQFWSKLTAIVLNFKGIAKRMRPLYAQLPDGPERYSRYLDKTLASGLPAYNEFKCLSG